MSTDSDEPHVPRGVSVRWCDDAGAASYRAAAQRRPETIVVRPLRRGLPAVGGMSGAGALGAAWLITHGITHARAFATLGGAALAVISGIVLDRIAPRWINRTELRFTDDALEVSVRPWGDDQPLRLPFDEVADFELETVVDPVAVPRVTRQQVNLRRRDGRVDPVVQGVDDPAAAAWLRAMLRTHARPT